MKTFQLNAEARTDLGKKAAKALLRKLIYSTDVYVIELTYDGQTRKAVLKDLQFHPVSDAVLHIDLLEVSEDKPVVVEIPVHLEGHAVGVKAGGKLYLSMKKVKVKGLYKVDKLEIGKTIKVRDCEFENYELVNAKDLVIAGVRTTRNAAAAAATEEGEEGAAEEAAPAAE